MFKTAHKIIIIPCLTIICSCSTVQPQKQNVAQITMPAVQAETFERDLINREPESSAGLWNEMRSRDFFRDLRAHRVGDLVTVNIVETSSASKSASTTTGRDSSINASINNMLGWENIKEMSDYGIEFGSHTLTHANLLYCKDEPRRLSFEVNESKRILEEKLNIPVISFAYPYGAGANDESIKKILKVAEYRIACGIKQGKVKLSHKDMLSLKRVLIRGDENMFDFRLNIETGKARL